jgi:amidase
MRGFAENTSSAVSDLTVPSPEEVLAIARLYHLTMTAEDVDVLRLQAARVLRSYKRVADIPEPIPEVKYQRDAGYRPPPEENPLNAWYWRCSIRGEVDGKLVGKTIAIKDNIAVAGLPMTNGSRVLEGYVPNIDATVVTRILDAGGQIVGKAVCEDFSLSGTSITAATGPVMNPHDHRYSAGGSSSGSAALVGAGECDMALGCDQGGSIRIPAAVCGVFGLKPTYGLVPYTAIFPLDNTLDHVGPIARTVRDLALLLEVIAGYDPLDPRQHPDIVPTQYSSVLTGDVRSLRVGVVQEGFGWKECVEPDVDECVREAAFRFEKLGARVREVSIPLHRDGISIYNPVLTEGGLVHLVTNGLGVGWKGYYSGGLAQFLGEARVRKADEFPLSVKLMIVLGHYMRERHHGRYYARAQNQVRLLEQAYDGAFERFDLLAMPTCAPAGTALPIPADITPAGVLQMAGLHHWNTCPLNLTGHPAISIPCGKSDLLPVGMMLVARRFQDDLLLRAARAFEYAGWAG